MSEEELIEKIQDEVELLNIDDRVLEISPKLQKELAKNIQGLLDLHNKEKEKNKELEHQQQVEIEGRNILVGLNENLKEELKKEKEKNKELYEDNQKQWAERCKLAIELDNNTVSKDKIREIIYPTPTNPISYEIQTSDMYKKLLELLEEE